MNGFGLHGVREADVTVVWVPGAFEVPMAAKTMAATGNFDAVVTLGAVIRGDTPHFDYVAGECARGIQNAQLATGVPIVFGVLTTENLEQALERSDEKDNKGEESVRTAIEMVDVLRKLRSS
jgi:6,7-dimethyl-8-ribityllumazine synthase